MKPIHTPDCDVNLTLPGGTAENDLPAQRILVYDTDQGQTKEDASLAFETLWMPDEAEARRLEAGAPVRLRVWGQAHPPVSVTVADAIVPERELIDRGHVDRALGWLYGNLKGHLTAAIREIPAQNGKVEADHFVGRDGDIDPETVGMPDPAAFADLWAEAVTATAQDGRPDQADASPVDEQPEP